MTVETMPSNVITSGLWTWCPIQAQFYCILVRSNQVRKIWCDLYHHHFIIVTILFSTFIRKHSTNFVNVAEFLMNYFILPRMEFFSMKTMRHTRLVEGMKIESDGKAFNRLLSSSNSLDTNFCKFLECWTRINLWKVWKFWMIIMLFLLIFLAYFTFYLKAMIGLSHNFTLLNFIFPN